ncbi:unnamed protein product [Caenorhabditis nigoni]
MRIAGIGQMFFTMKYFMALLLMTIVSNAQYRLYQTPDPLADQQRTFSGSKINEHSAHINSYDHDSNYNPSNHHRFRRAATTKHTVSLVVERMQMMARLINAVFLEKELIKGTLNPDKLISEFLHFGSITPSQIHDIKFTDIISALDLLKSLPSKLKSDDSLEEIEQLMEKIDKVLKAVDGIKDVTVWPEKNTIKTVIDTLASGTSAEFPLIPDLAKSISNWDTYYQESTDANAEAISISKLGAASSKILKAAETLKSETPTLSLFPNGKTATEMVQFLDKVVNGIAAVRKEKFKFPADGFGPLENHLKEINSVVAILKPVRKNIEITANLFIARSNGEKSSNYTLGLPEGYKDVIRLMGHFNDPWFSQTVKHKRVLKSLECVKSFEAVIRNLLYSKENDTARSVKKMNAAGSPVTVSSFESLAKDTQKLLGAFDELLKQTPDDVKALNCFLKTTNTKQTVGAITASKAVRNSATLYKEKMDDALKVFNSMESTKKDLKKVENLIKESFGFDSPEYHNLFGRYDDAELSNTIGSSVIAIGEMKRAIDAKTSIDTVKDDIDMLCKEADNANSLSAEDKKNLKDLSGISSKSVDSMFTELDAWKSEVSGLSFTNLTSYGQVFLKAKKVRGLDLDLGKTRKSLRKLIDEVTDSAKKDTLKKVKDGLDALDGMGMQFSSYAKSFDGTTSALTSLERFFSSFEPINFEDNNDDEQSCNLRLNRARAVQSADQFRFAHYALIELIVDTVGFSNLNEDDKRFVLGMRAAWTGIKEDIAKAKNAKEAKDNKDNK